MARKYSSTSVETTLASGINATQVTMTVPNSNAATALLGGQTLGNAVGGVYPDIFTVVIDPDTASEEVVFVQNVNGSTLVISRAQAGTGQTPGSTGIEHAAGATIRHVLTSSDLDFFRNGVATADAAIAKTIIDAKGDLIVGTAADTPARLAIGTNGQVLKVDSTTASGLTWGSDLGKILQVVEGDTTTQALSSTYGTFFDTTLTATITPSSATSKILIIATQAGLYLSPGGSGAASINFVLQRGTSTTLIQSQYALTNNANTTQVQFGQFIPMVKLDSPATTSAVTYKTRIAAAGFSGSFVGAQYFGERSTMVLMEVAG